MSSCGAASWMGTCETVALKRRWSAPTQIRAAPRRCFFPPQQCVPCFPPSRGLRLIVFRHRWLLRPLQVIRKHLEEHLGKEMAYHMILLKKSFDSCTKNMKDEFETVLKVIRPPTLGVIGRLTSSLFATRR